MEDQRHTIKRLAEEIKKRETRAWILAGFVLHQIAEKSRKPTRPARLFLVVPKRKD